MQRKPDRILESIYKNQNSTNTQFHDLHAQSQIQLNTLHTSTENQKRITEHTQRLETRNFDLKMSEAERTLAITNGL
jgi:hypothetical protein